MAIQFDINIQHRLWNVEMEILDVIDKVCRENGIKYSLAYGTMLGAVRHKGFIPWDDDLDIWMFREDYNRFIEIWETSNIKGYYLLSQDKAEEFGTNFIKIRKDNTAFVSKGEEHRDFHHGMFVDIFPLDNVGLTTSEEKIQRIYSLLSMLYSRGNASDHDGKLMYWGSKILLSIVPRKFYKTLRNYFNGKVQKYNGNPKATKMACFVTAGATQRQFKRDWFAKIIDVPFEDRKYMCYEDTDPILKVVYNDYMQLPPEEDRVWRHHPSIIDFENEFWPNNK